MYIGDTGVFGLTTLVLGVITFALERMPSPDQGVIEVELTTDGSTRIRENAISLPVGDVLLEMATEYLPWVCSESIELLILCTLTSRLDIDVHFDGVQWRQSFSRRRALGEVVRVGRTSRAGNVFTFRADEEVFTETQTVPTDALRSRFVELAAFRPGLRFTLNGETIQSPEGLDALYAPLAAGRTPLLADPIRGTIETEDGTAALVMGWHREAGVTIRSFANEGAVRAGRHVDGFQAALDEEASAPLSGLVAVLTIELPDIRYAGSTREVVSSPEAFRLMYALTQQCLRTFSAERFEEAAAIRSARGSHPG